MPQYNRNDLEIAARNQHFTRDTFEKVLRLKTILDWMNTHEFLNTHLLLKGGTAINLTVFDLPRLSVDIDMDFVPNLPREDMLQTRETISGIIKAYMDSEGYAFSPASRIHHSLDAFHFTYRPAAFSPILSTEHFSRRSGNLLIVGGQKECQKKCFSSAKPQYSDKTSLFHEYSLMLYESFDQTGQGFSEQKLSADS